MGERGEAGVHGGLRLMESVSAPVLAGDIALKGARGGDGVVAYPPGPLWGDIPLSPTFGGARAPG